MCKISRGKHIKNCIHIHALSFHAGAAGSPGLYDPSLDEMSVGPIGPQGDVGEVGDRGIYSNSSRIYKKCLLKQVSIFGISS